MASATSFNTLSKEGVDVTVVYTMTASLTPETPAPPFAIGDICEGMFGAQWVFVQASTSITVNDWLAIKGSMQANSLTTTNIAAAGGVQLGVAPGATAGNGGVNATMLAGTYFWAQIRGSQVAANGIAATSTSNVDLFTSATAGILTSTSGGIGVAGVIVTASLTTLAQTFMLTWPRAIGSAAVAAGGTINP